MTNYNSLFGSLLRGDWLKVSTERQPSDEREMTERRNKVHDRLRSLRAPHAQRMLRFAAAFLLLLTIGVGNAWGADVSVTINASTDVSSWSATGTEGSGSTTTVKKSDITISSTKGYKATEHVREYLGSSITVSSSVGNIKKIVFTSTASGTSDKGPSKIGLKSGESGEYTYSGNTGTWSFSSGVSSVTFSATAQFRWTQAVVTYIEAAPSYTITAATNNASMGTASLSGSVITGSPNSGYQYASPAYSVSPVGSATVSQDGDAFTVNPSANTTVTINFEAIPTYTLNYHDGDGDASKENVYEGTNLIEALGTPAASCDATSTTFVGWTTSELTTKTNTAPTFVAADAVVNSTTAAATYYAVYAKAGSKTSVIGGDISNGVGSGWTSNGTGAYSNNGVKFDNQNDYITSNDLSAYGYKAVTVKLKAGHNGGSGSILTIASLDASSNIIDSKTFTPTETYTSQNTEYSFELSGSSVIKYVRITMTSKTNNLGMKYCEVFYTPMSDYMTTCCTPLGGINGSVEWGRKRRGNRAFV